jgi:hypothetical protein
MSEAMSLVAAPNWSAVRQEYEERLFDPKVICVRHGITNAQLRYRRESEGWLSVRARVVRKDDLVPRMLKILDKQLRQLEASVKDPIDKQANVLGTMIKNLDKLIEMGAAKPNADPPTRKDMTVLREKLVQRIVQSRRS